MTAVAAVGGAVGAASGGGVVAQYRIATEVGDRRSGTCYVGSIRMTPGEVD